MRPSPNALHAGAMVATVLAFLCAFGIEPDVAGEIPPPPPTRVATAVPDAAVVEGRAADPRPNILLFTIDTLRVDHSSTYGYERETTPALTRLAAHGTRFSRAYSASTWTVPAIVSMLTGVLPSAHGVVHGFWLDADNVVGQEIVSPELPMLPALLHDAGYRTVGVAANVHLDAGLGFGRGFDSYTSLDYFTQTTTELGAEVARHLDELRASETPWFLWVHVIEPHAPYQARRPIFDAWRPPSTPQYPAIETVLLEEYLEDLMNRQHIPLADGIAYTLAVYDSEIRTADDYLATLLGELDDGHLAVLVAADHGEEFRDHLRYGHGHTAFDEVARIPLVLAVPGATARSVDDTVSLLDVLPTLLDVAHAPAPSTGAGRSLLGATRGEPLEARPAIIETGRGREVVRAIVEGSIKYGRRVTPSPIEGLFDVDADPHEVHNIIDERPEVAIAMGARLEAIVAAAAAQRPELSTAQIQMTDRVREQLEALGYLH